MNFLRESPEGIRWAEYRKLELLLSLPFALVIWCYLEFLWILSNRISRLVEIDSVPPSAILYGFHYDSLQNYISTTLISKSGRAIRWIGFHGFLSYLGFFVGCLRTSRYVRFHPRGTKPALDELVEILQKHPNTLFGIFTDAGGPYRRVRESLVKLSIATGRPLVPLHSSFSPKVKIHGHSVPFPFGKCVVNFGVPTFPNELKQLDLQTARDTLEKRLDATN